MRRLADPHLVEPATGPLDAVAVVPGSKSITNRALVCAALAAGRSTLAGALRADDTDAMIEGLTALGARIELGEELAVTGCGGELATPTAAIDTRQSGTTSRFVLPLLALGRGRYEVRAHAQMQLRPMGETFAALRSLGVAVEEQGAADRLPVVATTSGPPTTRPEIDVDGSVSSQFLSGLLLVAPCLPAGLVLRTTGPLVSRPYVDLTIAVMAAFGAAVHRPDDGSFVVEPTGYLATDYRIEPDASAASYAFAAAAACGGRVTVPGIGSHPLQGDAAFVRVLEQMGATVTVEASATTVTAERGALRGGTFDLGDLSDTAQTLAAIAPLAAGPVAVTGIGFIRHKEIDRVAAVATELRRCGIDVDLDPDGWTIHPGPVRPTVVQTYEDHRMAMSFGVLGLAVGGIEIVDPGCVAKTFPGYWDLLDGLRPARADR